MDRTDLMMDNEAVDMSHRKSDAVLESSKSVLTHVPRTPLMDVKNQFRSKARLRMSTGSMVHSGLSVKHRLSLNDQESTENFQSQAKPFKQPHDEREEVKVELGMPERNVEEEASSQADASSLIPLSCDMSTFADTVDESILQEKLGELSKEAEEISRDSDLLKDIMLVLDQDLHASDTDPTESPSEQDESFTLPSLVTSRIYGDSSVESTEQILSEIQAIEFERTFEGGGESNCDGHAECGSMIGGNHILDDASLPDLNVGEEDGTLHETAGHVLTFEDGETLEQISAVKELLIDRGNESLSYDDAEAELTISKAADHSYGYLSSSLRESLTGSNVTMMSQNDLDMIGDSLHELSSIRCVEGCEEETALDALCDHTLTEGTLQADCGENFSKVEKIVQVQEKCENEEHISPVVESVGGSLPSGNLDGACNLSGLARDGETAHDSSGSSTSLLVDLSISEAEALNCFDCTSDMAKFIDEFLKETPVLQQHHGRVARLKPQTVGKRDDLWPAEKNVDDNNEESRYKPSSLSTSLVISAGDDKNSPRKLNDVNQVLLLSDKDPAESKGDEALVTKLGMCEEGGAPRDNTAEVKDNNTRLLPEGEELLDSVDAEEESSTLCDKDVVVVKDVVIESFFEATSNKLENVDESADLYSYRVTKVLESLRDACVPSNIEEVPVIGSQLGICLEKLPSDEESLHELVEHPARTEVVVTGAFGNVTSQTGISDEQSEYQDADVIKDLNSLSLGPAPCNLEAFVIGETLEKSIADSELGHLVEGLDDCRLSVSDNATSAKNDKVTMSTESDELERAASPDRDSSTDDNDNAAGTSEQRQNLNRSTLEMKEEIQTLELQMAEMKQKVAWLESQIESNSQHEDVTQQTQQTYHLDVPDQANMSSASFQLTDGTEDENELGIQLEENANVMKDLESRLAEELVKTQTLENHVKEVERKCSLLEKERLRSELNFTKEVRRLKAECAQSINSKQAEVEEGVAGMHQDFECMMLEFEQSTTLQTKLKAMLNKVMKTTNQSLAGYAKLLKDYSDLQQSHQSMETQLSSSKTDNKKLVDDVDVLEDLLQRSNDSIKELHQLYQEEIENLKSQAFSLSQDLDGASKEKEATKKSLESHVDQLQQSLDRLESERLANQEELEDSRFLLEHQKTKNQTLMDELEELRKIKVDWVAGQDWIKELEDTISFLNEEKDMFDTELKEAKKIMAGLESQVKSLLEATEEYQRTQDLLQTEASGLRDRLEVTGEDAAMLLATLEDVESMVDSLVGALQHKFGTETTPKQATCPSSLVAQVLSRAGVEGGGGGAGQCPSTCSKLSSVKAKSARRRLHLDDSFVKNGDYPILSGAKVPSSRKALDFSSPSNPGVTGNKVSPTVTPGVTGNKKSPTAPVSQIHEHNMAGQGSGTSIPGFALIRSIPVSERKSDRQEDRLSSVSDDCNVLAICEHVLESVEQKFTAIRNLAYTTDKASRLKMRELQAEVDMLGEKCKAKREVAERLNTELEYKGRQLEESRGEIGQLNERVGRMTQAILKHEDMTYELKRLEEDNLDLVQEVSSLKGERDMLSRQVQDLIAGTKGGEGQQDSLKKTAALEKKVYQLNRYLLQEQEKTTEKGNKAMRRIRVLEMNLKRAEEEVYKFDELVEAIRNSCLENRSMRPHPVLLHVVRLIDGLVEVGNKPITTSTSNSTTTATTTTTTDRRGRKSQANDADSASAAVSSASRTTFTLPMSSAHSTSTKGGKEVEEYRV